MGLYFQMQEGSGAFGARVHGAIGASPLGTTGSAHRASWFKGSYKVSLRWRGTAPFGANFICRLTAAGKTVQPPWRAMEMHPYSRCAGLPPKGETTHYILCVALLLQNVFAVHPGGGSSSGAMLCDTCEIIAFRSFIMPPLLWRHRSWICFVGKRPESPVTCFPVEKGGTLASKEYISNGRFPAADRQPINSSP